MSVTIKQLSADLQEASDNLKNLVGHCNQEGKPSKYAHRHQVEKFIDGTHAIVKTQSLFSRVRENLANNFLTNNRLWNISEYKFVATLVTGVAILAVAAGAFYGVSAFCGLAIAGYAAGGTFALEMLTIAVRAKRQINSEVREINKAIKEFDSGSKLIEDAHREATLKENREATLNQFCETHVGTVQAQARASASQEASANASQEALDRASQEASDRASRTRKFVGLGTGALVLGYAAKAYLAGRNTN